MRSVSLDGSEAILWVWMDEKRFFGWMRSVPSSGIPLTPGQKGEQGEKLERSGEALKPKYSTC
jgi:hypothetical protein